MKFVTTALLVTVMMIDQAFAGGWDIVPTPTPVPEIDGSGALTAIALLAGVAAIFFSKNR